MAMTNEGESRTDMTDMKNVNEMNVGIIEEFRANGGRVGGMFEGAPMLLLHSTGAKSGKERINPLMYLQLDGGYAIFASKAGAPTNPDWYHNLRANPTTSVELGQETVAVVAREAVVDPDRHRVTDVQVAVGFRRETRDNRLAASRRQIRIDDVGQEVGLPGAVALSIRACAAIRVHVRASAPCMAPDGSGRRRMSRRRR
jgi:deazaflavin-dependent oxidoreductase (nitroreductase family)